MIYTLSLNPSLDHIVSVGSLQLGGLNRADGDLLLPGGKGINVSTVLSCLGTENTAVYFAAGFVGEEIGRRLAGSGIRTEAIFLREGCSRINIKIRHPEVTEINGRGPEIGAEGLRRLDGVMERLQPGDVMVLAGSIPPGVPESLYGDLMRRQAGRGIRFVVDASGEALRSALQYGPFLVKPNKEELESLFGETADTEESLFACAWQLQEMGACNVLISLGEKGAALLTGDGRRLRRTAPEGTAVNTVGAGDSMVAGFLASFLEDGDPERAFRMGLAAGSASAFSLHLAEREEILRLYERMQ